MTIDLKEILSEWYAKLELSRRLLGQKKAALSGAAWEYRN